MAAGAPGFRLQAAACPSMLSVPSGEVPPPISQRTGPHSSYPAGMRPSSPALRRLGICRPIIGWSPNRHPLKWRASANILGVWRMYLQLLLDWTGTLNQSTRHSATSGLSSLNVTLALAESRRWRRSAFLTPSFSLQVYKTF